MKNPWGLGVAATYPGCKLTQMIRVSTRLKGGEMVIFLNDVCCYMIRRNMWCIYNTYRKIYIWYEQIVHNAIIVCTYRIYIYIHDINDTYNMQDINDRDTMPEMMAASDWNITLGWCLFCLASFFLSIFEECNSKTCALSRWSCIFPRRWHTRIWCC